MPCCLVNLTPLDLWAPSGGLASGSGNMQFTPECCFEALLGGSSFSMPCSSHGVRATADILSQKRTCVAYYLVIFARSLK